MFNLENAIRAWNKSLRRSAHIRDTDLAELESHLREEIDAQLGLGLDSEAAFLAAAAECAPAEVLGEEFGRARPAGIHRSPWHPARLLPVPVWKAMTAGLRKMRKHKGQTILQVGGLTIGLACFTLIMLYVRYESNYDAQHAGADHIYRVAYEIMLESPSAGAVTPAPLAPLLMERLPEVRTATRFVPNEPILFQAGERGVPDSGIFADANFFRVFSFPLLRGDPQRLLADLDSIVISRNLAGRLFGAEDPLGRVLRCFLGDFKVTGVLEDVPENSHFRFDWVLPVERRWPADRREERLNRWNMDMFYTYVALNDGVPARDFEAKMAPVLRDQYKGLAQSSGKDWWNIRAGIRYFLQPLKSIHLESQLNYEIEPNGSLRTIRLFAAVAALILLIACINAANLAAARSSLRIKEVGIRKSVGARRRHIVGQFLGESQLIAAAALAASVGAAVLVLPAFKRFAEKPLSLDGLWEGPFPVLLVSAAIAAGLLSGLYPAVSLSAFSPLNALRRGRAARRGNLGARNSLVFIQFGLTIVLIAGALTVFKQMRFIRTRDIGYDRTGVIQLTAADSGFLRSLDAFKTTLGRNPDILGVSTASQPLAEVSGAGGRPMLDDLGRKVLMRYYFLGTDHNFTDFARIEIVRGRGFSPEIATDAQSAVLVNEAFVRRAGWADPVGRRLPLMDEDKDNEIVGVVKDFHFRSMRETIEPLVMTCRPNSYYVLIRARPGRIPEALAAVREAYEGFGPQYPFDASFLDDEFVRLYAADAKLGWMLVLFSGLAVILGGMGILGLAAAAADQRTKEIGIRKVLGASPSNLFLMISREFSRWVLLANLVAWPVAYLAMNNWLRNFAYRTSPGIGVLVAAALVTLAIAVFTAGYHALRAALSDPVVSLRYE